MAYATFEDVQKRLLRLLSEDEKKVCEELLCDASILIDTYNENAKEEAKKVVSCRMVIRAIGSGDIETTPIGATQGSMSALGYSQSWTISNGSVGQLYLDKTDKKYLGCGSKIGAGSPIESMVEE